MNEKQYYELEGRVDLYSQAVSDFETVHERAMEDNPTAGNSLYVQTVKCSQSAFELFKELMAEPELPKAFRSSLLEKKLRVMLKLAELEARHSQTPVGV